MGTESFEKPQKDTRIETEEEERSTGEMHVTNLFDEHAGIDEATGKEITNVEPETVPSTHSEIGEDDPLLQKLSEGETFEEENDAAGKWLKEHDKNK